MKRLVVVCLILAPVFLSGCVLDTILDDMVNTAPRAVIDANPVQGPAPLTVELDAHYSHDDDGTIAEYRWDVNDPTDTGSKLGTACEHTFQHPGTYLVKLSVLDNEGATDSQQIAIVVTNAPPVAQATVSDSAPFPGDEVWFDAGDSYDLTGEIVSYHWEFGDGTSASGVTATHTYLEGNYYVVTLTVTDDQGASGTVRLNLNVQPGSSNCGDSGGTCGDGVYVLAVVSGLPTSCSNPVRAGEPVTLDGTYSRSEGGKVVKYAWDFGDGTIATGPVVTHVYAKAWTYSVKLTVTDEGGNTGSATVPCPIGPASCS